MYHRISDSELVAFLGTLQCSLAFAHKMVEEYQAEFDAARSVKPETIRSELDRQSSWSLRNLYAAQVRLLEQTISDFNEQFNEYLPQEDSDEQRAA